MSRQEKHGWPLLRITAEGADTAPHRFTIVFRGDDIHLSTTSEVPPPLSPEEAESIRWYLEEYRRFPFEPAPTIASNTAARLKALGEEWFARIFNSSAERREVWNRVEEQIDATRIELAVDSSLLAAPWEVLWNPLAISPVACQVRSFVRGGFPPAASATAERGPIRVLLVISRPAGVLDAPFRSVAARLLDRIHGDDRFRFEVLRPPTFEAFESALQRAVDQGRPYHIVHFDGHGVHEDLSATMEGRPARRRRGYLVFESASNPDRPDYVDAGMLRDALGVRGAPILILNACRSARAETWTERMGARRPLGSLADELMRLGQPAVLAMQYNVEVDTASRFVTDLYAGLAEGDSLAAAVTAARRQLFETGGRTGDGRSPEVYDWLVPVLFEAAPRALTIDPSRRRHKRPYPNGPAAAGTGGDDTLMAIERAFQTSTVVVLAGPVGSGKTTIASDFAVWDARTRDEPARSPLYLRDGTTGDAAEIVTAEGRAIIETRDTTVSAAPGCSVVRMKPLDLPERIALIRHHLPPNTPFDPDAWQAILAFSQGNPGVLVRLAALAADPSSTLAAVLDAARSQPIGLEPAVLVSALSALTQEDLDTVAIAALFEGPVSARTLRMLASAGSTTAPPLEDADTAFDRLAALGLAAPIGSSYYQMHPGLPGLLRPELERRYPGARGENVRSGAVALLSAICAVFLKHGDSGERNAYEKQKQTLSLIEPTLYRILDLAVALELWPDARNVTTALHRVLTEQGRRAEWRRLVKRLQMLVPEDDNGNPPASRESLWYLLEDDRIDHLVRVHALGEAAWLQERSLRHVREQSGDAEDTESHEYARQVVIPQLRRMGDIRRAQREPGAIDHYLEALMTAQRFHFEIDEQRMAGRLADFHLSQEPNDWEELEYWRCYASELCPSHDRIGQAHLAVLAGDIALARAQPAQAVERFRVALTSLLPGDPSDDRAECELKLGTALFRQRVDLAECLQHVQSAIAWYDHDGNVFRASSARLTASRMLAEAAEGGRAYFYAAEAARGFAGLAPHAEQEAGEAARIAEALTDHTRTPKEDA